MRRTMKKIMIEKVNSEQARALNLGRVSRRGSGVHAVVLILASTRMPGRVGKSGASVLKH